jgi:hypothetical protein
MEAPWMDLLRQQRQIIEQQSKTIQEQAQTIREQRDQLQLQAQKIAVLEETVQHLRDEIAILKGVKPKPKIEPSRLGKDKDRKPPEKRPGSEKRKKTATLKIHETKTVRPDGIPPGSQFKGYREFTVQDLLITVRNTLYRLERWESPDGQPIEARMPANIDGHFGNFLKSYILYQYHQCHVTEPLLLEQFREFGIDISSGQINFILTEGNEPFHEEKDALLATGLSVSSYIQTDDTGARHDGKNGVCTVIGNSNFTWFKSTNSKSRINFLKLLRAGARDYVLNDEALAYMKARKLPHFPIKTLTLGRGNTFQTRKAWKRYLASLEITDKRHIRIATEGALMGSLVSHRFSKELIILSDDAGQFEIKRLLHALCWIHAERNIKKIIPYTDEQRVDLEKIRDQIWTYYGELKAYCNECLKTGEHPRWKEYLCFRFDEIFQASTCFATLNHALKQIQKNKIELLLVLDHPEIPLHNNGSESDIREYVKRRKVSGSTRSPLGRKARDTFTSLKKTCRKLGVSFWAYLNDRVAGFHQIPDLQQLILNRVTVPE